MRNPQQAAQVTRICRKLETAWLARPDDGFGAFSWTIGALIGAHPDMLAVLTDDELEQRLDAYLAKRGLPNEWILPRTTLKPIECHGLDTPERVFFYEQDFYVLSNFSAFTVRINGRTFPTSEHAYHFFKFKDHAIGYALAILDAPSAHEAFKIAERHKADRRHDWDDVKVGIMREIIRAKTEQHEYVRCKLLATGDRELVENSWRDSFWGWGPGEDGQNMLGKIWMELRAELRAAGLPVCVHCRREIGPLSIYHSHKKDVETVSDYLERIVKLPEAEWLLEAGRHAPGCAWVKHRGQLVACA